MNEEYVLEVLNPRSVLKTEPLKGITPRPATLDGKRIAIIPDKPDSDLFLDMLEKLIYDKYPSAIISRVFISAFDKPEWAAEQVVGKYDVWIEGVKTAAHWEIDRMAGLEKAGVPGATIVVSEYLPQRRRLATANGVPGLRIATVDTEKFFTHGDIPKKVMDIAKEAFDGIIHALLDPVTEEEANPTPFEYDYSNLRFTGKDFSEANDKFQDYFYENELGEGLGLVPPTKSAVEHMLSGTSRSPEEVLGIMEPGKGIATIEKVAINAVMAGAKPEYLPVIIAAVEGLSDPDFDTYHIQVCHIGSAAQISVHGPIAKEIGMNGKTAYLSPGNRANSSIGRAINLCLQNIGWAFYRIEGGFGQGSISRYCNVIFCENEEDSPWEPFSVEHGYSPEESVVLIEEALSSLHGSFGTMGMKGLDAELQYLASMLSNWGGERNPVLCLKTGTNTIMMYPAQARQLAAAGFTKESLLTELINRRRIPWNSLSPKDRKEYLRLAEEGSIPLLSVEDCQPFRTVPLMNRDRQRIIVVGPMAGRTIGYAGYGNYKSYMRGYDYRENPHNIKKIHGATLTKSGK